MVGERERARASTSRGRSARGARASRSTACRPTRAPSTERATTRGCWRGTSPRRDFGIEPERPHLAPDEVAGFLAAELAEAPELFHQRGYLARVLTADPAGGVRDDGVQPLAHVLDGEGPDAIAATLEGDGSGAIYPVVYTRIGGTVVEQAIEPDPLMRFDTADARRADRRPRAAGDGPLTGRQTAVASRASRSAAADQRLEPLGEGEPQLRPAELGPREERRARHGRHARVPDEPHARTPRRPRPLRRGRDVGHHVVGAGRLVDPEAGRAQRRQEQVAPRAVAGDEVRVVASGNPSATTAAACSGAAAPTVRKSWTRRMPTDRSGGAIVQPIRQPVTEYDFDIEWIETVRSAIPGSVASGMCSPSNTMCS